jgi:single-strand DNA-binding protein
MYNRVILIGRIAADPELRTTPGGDNVTTIRVAVNRSYNKDKADFISVVAWKRTAEFICNYFPKGSAIGIEGSIQVRDYTDKEGNKRNVVEVAADRVFFVESKKKDKPQDEFEAVDDFDDLPFK